MELKFWKEYEDERTGYSLKTYRIEDTIQQGSFCDLLESFENDSICFYDCTCDTYDEKGYPASPTFKNIDKMRNCIFDNAAVGFMANYINRHTQEYQFSIISSINSNMVQIKFDPKMVSIIRERIARDKMFEDLRKIEN